MHKSVGKDSRYTHDSASNSQSASQTNADREHDLSPWLALLRVPGLGPATLDNLLAVFKRPAAILEADQQSLAQCGIKAAIITSMQRPDWHQVEQDLRWARQAGRFILTRGDPHYPALLQQIPTPPPLLFVEGDPACLASHQLAMVGSRNPSPVGRETAGAFAASLSQAGLVITSGLAMGIDAASHAGALHGGGHTVAVIGSGPDMVYPAKNRELAAKIVENGCIVSEFPPGTLPRSAHFPRRNRIISGLSLGCLVVEAATRSGSLITARLAAEQGREVFAIPGSIHLPTARGCHQLIRQGAKLVETATDVLEELGPLSHWLTSAQASAPVSQGELALGAPPRPDNSHTDLEVTAIALLEQMGHEPVTIDQMVARCGLTADQVSRILLVLELHDHVHTVPGGLYARMGNARKRTE
ncbi:MAG: DNA-processing protein DprA [Gammaproteobacteria bacterium]|nr:MAG: DNA-processing protein DprA [Gammaproteobacteria bacterium]